METWTGARADLDRRAAGWLAEHVRAVLRTRPYAVLGLVGGRSVGGIYHNLAALDLPWEKLHIFLADERLVPPTSPESNFRLVREDLLSDAIASGPADPRPGIAAYGAALDAQGGRFDAVVLSAGEDGHCASLFPGHPSIDDEGERFILVGNAPKPPALRLSASRRLLQRSALGLVVFYGEEKRAALARFRDPAVGVRDCPSKLLAAIEKACLLTDLD